MIIKKNSNGIFPYLYTTVFGTLPNYFITYYIGLGLVLGTLPITIPSIILSKLPVVSFWRRLYDGITYYLRGCIAMIIGTAILFYGFNWFPNVFSVWSMFLYFSAAFLDGAVVLILVFYHKRITLITADGIRRPVLNPNGPWVKGNPFLKSWNKLLGHCTRIVWVDEVNIRTDTQSSPEAGTIFFRKP